ncbi:hypothetical protein ACWGHM_30305 [Streptomyces sp. NPDC054904]
MYGFSAILGSLTVVVISLVFMPFDYTRNQVIVGTGLGFAAAVVVWPLLTMGFVPMAVASYSAWWMPQAERTAHRQDILYVLTHVQLMRRSRYAWQLLLSSPRSGLRQRRLHARLTTASAGYARDL